MPEKSMAHLDQTQILKDAITGIVRASAQKTPVREVVRNASVRLGVDTATVRDAIRQLIMEKTLAYTYLYGTSFLEASFDKAVRVSSRIVIKPPRLRYHPKKDEVVIEMANGTAFGEGRHPTTRLVLRAIDEALDVQNSPAWPGSMGLDVGTGTGILAIALARLGVKKVLGTDIDPCALSEARHNVLCNKLGDRVTIEDTALEWLTNTFDIVLANLAFPTLKGMAPALVDLTKPTGILILSGFRTSVLPAVQAAFAPLGVLLKEETNERGWACTTWYKP